jgi:hypothetical protein
LRGSFFKISYFSFLLPSFFHCSSVFIFFLYFLLSCIFHSSSAAVSPCSLHVPSPSTQHSPPLVRSQYLQAHLCQLSTDTANFDQRASCPIASVNSLPNTRHSHTIIGERYTFFASSHTTNWGPTSWLSLLILNEFSDWPRPLSAHISQVNFTVIMC